MQPSVLIASQRYGESHMCSIVIGLGNHQREQKQTKCYSTEHLSKNVCELYCCQHTSVETIHNKIECNHTLTSLQKAKDGIQESFRLLTEDPHLGPVEGIRHQVLKEDASLRLVRSILASESVPATSLGRRRAHWVTQRSTLDLSSHTASTDK